MNSETYDLELLAALAHKIRKEVVLFLLKQEHDVKASDIANVLNRSPDCVSYALKSLRRAGIVVEDRKNGKQISYYRISVRTANAVRIKLLGLAKLFK